MNNLLHFGVADAGISPTRWQASTFPQSFRDKITVVHDGIDMQAIALNPAVSLTLTGNITSLKVEKKGDQPMESIEKQLASLLTAQAGNDVKQEEVAAFAEKLGNILGKPGEAPEPAKTESE